MTHRTPQDALRHHITGAIERGEKEAIVEQKHTPREWDWEQNLRGDGMPLNSFVIFAPTQSQPGFDGESFICIAETYNKANARLISEAPTLYSLARAWLMSDPHGTHSEVLRQTIAKIEGDI